MPPHHRFLCSYRLRVAVLAGALVLAGSFHASFPRVQAASLTTLTIGWAQDATNLDPTAAMSHANAAVTAEIYDQLLRVGSNGSGLQPDLATSWTSSRNRKTYTFHLRPNVYFSNGRKLTAADVAFSLNRARGSSSAWNWLLPALKTVSAPNASTVRITLHHALSPFLSDMAVYGLGVYPRSYFQRVGPRGLAAHPIGTGPYVLQSWQHGHDLILQKNPRYWAADQYPMQRIVLRVIPNDTTRLRELAVGRIDVDNVPPAGLVPRVRSTSKIQVQVAPSTLVTYLTLNDALPQFHDTRVRQAMDFVINREALVAAVLHGNGTPATSYIPKGADDFDPTIGVPPYDLVLAEKILSESGYPHGFTMPYEVPIGNREYREIATIVRAELAPLGIKLQIVGVAPARLHVLQHTDRFHMMATSWIDPITDPAALTSFALGRNRSSHALYTWYSSKKTTRVIEEAERSNFRSARQLLYDTIQETWSEQVPFYALYYQPFVNAVSSKVTGFAENPLGFFVLQGVNKS